MSSLQSSMELSVLLSELMHSLRELKEIVMLPGAVGQGVIFDQFTGEVMIGDAAELLVRALVTIDVTDDSTNGSVIRFPGCFEVSQGVIDHVHCLNASKEKFKQCVKALEDSGLKPHDLRGTYRKLGYSRIHPLQAWRQVNVLNGGGLESIGFSVAKSTEGIETMSLSQLEARLQAADASDLIGSLKGGDIPGQVQWHTPVSRHIRANIVWKTDGIITRSMLHASMPFLVPEGAWPAKRIRFNQPRTHSKRSDSRAKNVVHVPFRAGAYISWE